MAPSKLIGSDAFFGVDAKEVDESVVAFDIMASRLSLKPPLFAFGLEDLVTEPPLFAEGFADIAAVVDEDNVLVAGTSVTGTDEDNVLVAGTSVTGTLLLTPSPCE